MANKEIFKSASGIRFFGGLEWRLLDVDHNIDASLRTIGGDRSATHVATAKSHAPETLKVGKKTKKIHRYAGGFLAFFDGDELGKKAHSLASAFALWTAQHDKAALSVHVADGAIAVVVVLNGLPYLDKVVENESEAYLIVTGYLKDHPTMSIFSDDLEKFPSSLMEMGLLEAIAGSAGKATQIKDIPADVVKLTMIVVVAIALFAGYQYYNKNKKEAARKLLVQKQRDEDPVPKYLSALNAQRATLGVDRNALIAAFNSAKKIPVAASGWRLDTVQCEMLAGCSANFKRTNGTYQQLVKSVDFLKLTQAESMDLNRARMTWKQGMEPALVDLSELPMEFQKFIEEEPGSTFQNWMVAGFSLSLQPPVLWPSVAGVPPGFKHASAIRVGKIEVSNISLAVLEEVLLSSPKNIFWKDFVMVVGDPKDAIKSLVKAKVSGSYYVKN